MPVFLTDIPQIPEQWLHSMHPINIGWHLLNQTDNLQIFILLSVLQSVRFVPKQKCNLQFVNPSVFEGISFFLQNLSLPIKYSFITSPQVAHHADFSLIRKFYISLHSQK